MKINNQNNINFTAIHLKNTTFEDTKKVTKFLQQNCFDALGYKRFYVSANNREGILRCVKYQRTYNMDGSPNKFGVVVFPWSKEAYILSTLKDEQEMITLLNDYTKKASINLLL